MRSNDEGQYGVCVFSNGTECEEWAYFRGECAKNEESTECTTDADCVKGGCSGTICQSKDAEPIFTTCEYLPEYECYKQIKCGCIDSKCQWSKITEFDGEKRNINGKSTQMRINSQAFSVLLYALGVPKGDKSYAKIFVPKWIKISPLWIKRLYLAGLFGAELSKPQQSKGENFNFKEPSLSQNKINELLPSLKEFLSDIKIFKYNDKTFPWHLPIPRRSTFFRE